VHGTVKRFAQTPAVERLATSDPGPARQTEYYPDWHLLFDALLV
jgi:hypothetical protein